MAQQDIVLRNVYCFIYWHFDAEKIAIPRIENGMTMDPRGCGFMLKSDISSNRWNGFLK